MQCVSIGGRAKYSYSETSLIDWIICAVGYAVISLRGGREKTAPFPPEILIYVVHHY